MRVGTQGLFCPYLKTFVTPFFPTRLTAPGSPRMANTILTTVFPSAVVRFSLSPLMYPTSVYYFVCLFPSFFRSVLIAEISSSLSFFVVVVVFYHW